MTNKYYYLVASLPYLKFEEKPPISKKKFIDECAKWLTPSDMEIILAAEKGCQKIRCANAEALKEWKTFEGDLSKELAAIREARKKGEEIKTSEMFRNILREETPLLMEEKLERARWSFLEEKETEHFFDVNWLIVYFLKIKIMERMAQFDKDKGEAIFYKLCEVDYEKAVR